MLVATLAEIKEALLNGSWSGRIGVVNESELLGPEHVRAFDAIYANHGLQHGDPVLIIVDHCVASVGALIAAWAAGLVAVPVKNERTLSSYWAIARNSGARLIVDARTAHAVPVEDAPARPESVFRYRTRRAVAGTDLAMIIYTSGSTGTPKGIMLTHSNVLSALHAISSYLGLQPTDRILCLSPLSFDYGLYQILFSFHVGCSVTLLGKSFNPLSCLKTLRAENVTVLPIVPSIGTALARVATACRVTCPNLRLITNTGGHLPEGIVSILSRVFDQAEIFLMYGLSETKRALFLDPREISRRPGSVGLPMPGMEAKLFNEVVEGEQVYFEEVARGEIGTLFLRGPSLMQGYYGGAEGSGVRLISGAYRDDNWLSTGDLFSQDSDGYFYFRGRAKELIKQGGYCLSPRDIEAVVERNPDVAVAVVVGVQDDWGVEMACLVAQLTNDEVSLPAAKQLEAWVAEHILPDYRPRSIRLMRNIPVSPNGKVDRSLVRAEVTAERSERGCDVAP